MELSNWEASQEPPRPNDAIEALRNLTRRIQETRVLPDHLANLIGNASDME